MTRHVMLDLETWGTAPGCDIRSIGAVVFDPQTGWVAGHEDGMDDGGIDQLQTFHIACENPAILCAYCQARGSCLQANGNPCAHCGGTGNDPNKYKYPLTRDPATVQWWNDQSDEAKASFVNPVDLKDALLRLCEWIALITGRNYNYPAQPDDIRLWSHGPSFDPPILAAAYAACRLSVPWHYRAPRDTRTALELAGMDPHKGLEPFNTGTHHNALDDAICQARAVCEAYRRLRVSHDVVTHRDAWREGIRLAMDEASEGSENPDADRSYWRHELTAFDRTFQTLANHPQLEK